MELIGRRLGHYTVLELLGRGGMGKVYVALDERLGRRVALKVLPPELASSGERLERFRREARAVAALHHPNIVTIHAVEEMEGIHFLILELVRGRSLDRVIAEGGLPPDRFLAIALPLVEALGAAHAQGIIHRDLKPSNVMVAEDGQVKILDFGLAKAAGAGSGDGAQQVTEGESMTRTGAVLGTLPYMSPEQLEGRPVDHRTDLFSLGVLLFEMAVGKRPFGGESLGSQIASILRDRPDLERPELAPPLREVLGRCLAKLPDERYATAAEAGAVLGRWAEELGEGRRPRALARPGPWVSAPWRAVLLALVLGVAALGGALGWRAWRQGGEATPGVERSVLAVQPFVNLSGNSAKEYLAQGLRAGLLTRLSEFTGLQVLDRGTLPDAVDSRQTLEEARRLGATALLSGELQSAVPRVHVDLRLTDTALGMILWSGSFESADEDLVDLESEMTRQVAEVLAVPLSRRERERLARQPTRSLEAYDYFLRGFQQSRAPSDPRAIAKAVEMYRQALRVDPAFALAHVGLSDVLWRRWAAGHERRDLDEAAKAAGRALELDPDLPGAQVALARVLRSQGDLKGSIALLESALARHPKPDIAQRELAASWIDAGDLAEAERCLRAAVAVGGSDWVNWNWLGNLLARLGRYVEAEEAYRQAAQRAPGQVTLAQQNLAAMLIQQGRFDEAIAAYERITAPIEDASLAANIATAYFFSQHADKWERAERYYRRAVALAPEDEGNWRNLGDLLLERGRRAEATEAYGRALARIEAQLAGAPRDLELRILRVLVAAKAGKCPLALEAAAAVRAELPDTAQDLHRVALGYALCERPAEAMAALRRAVDLGFSPEILRQESELAALRELSEFRALTAPRGGRSAG